MRIRTTLTILLMLALVAAAPLWGQTRRLDLTTFVVVGEGLAAGMADFALKSANQEKSFPAVMAKQMNTHFPQPLIQSPGIGVSPGYPVLPPVVTLHRQTTVRESAFNLFVFNLSIPGAKLADAVNRRPVNPVVQADDAQQTVTNLLIGFPSLVLTEDVPLWSQLEYAQRMFPTLILVELGYVEVLDAAVKNDPALLPAVASFRTDYIRLISGLASTFAEMIVLTIPDPIDTGYFSSQDTAASIIGAPAPVLRTLYKLNTGDLLTPHGLVAIATQIEAGKIGALPAGSVVSAATASQVSARVVALNAEITSVAQANRATVYNLAGLFRRVKTPGVAVGTRTLTADYHFGGFYSLDGYYPNAAGHALIANELLALVNQTYGRSFAAVDVAPLLPTDPIGKSYASRRGYTTDELQKLIPNLQELMKEEVPEDPASSPQNRRPVSPTGSKGGQE